jgi:hypothetical protein
MLSAGSFVRLRRLEGRRRWLLLRAAGLLGVSSAMVALFPFQRAIRFGSLALHDGPVSIGDVVWAVEAAARRVPWRAMCIEKGLAVQRMLRSGGVDAILHYGARHGPDGGRLEAHVWVSVGGDTILGGEQAADFAELATFP